MSRILAGSALTEPPAITEARHAAAVESAMASLKRALDVGTLGEEIVLEEIREALRSLGEITGDVANDDLYDRIFSTFCIGK
jgi:tRNA modification GTPase